MNQKQLENALMAYLARDDADRPRFQSLTTIYEKLPERHILTELHQDDDEIEDKEELRAALDQLVQDGIVETRWGEREYEGSYRITQDRLYDERVSAEGIVPAPNAPQTDSSDWTGGRLLYVDSLVLGKIRVVAGQLQVASQRVNFQNKSDEEDVKGLCDALVGLCKMAQPEISIIDQITSHPKFKHYAALLAFLATIRGALGL